MKNKKNNKKTKIVVNKKTDKISKVAKKPIPQNKNSIELKIKNPSKVAKKNIISSKNNSKIDKIKSPKKDLKIDSKNFQKKPLKKTTKPEKPEKIAKKSASIKNNNRDSNTNSTSKPNNFSINSYVVYPSHGVGKIINIETSKINQIEISCYLIYFDREKLTIRIPLKNVDKFNIRPLVSKSEMEEVFSILRSGIKKMKGMWSRRAQEYETKINSGDIVMLAEVIRDLTRDIEDSERSYSERIIYETAIFRLASEYSAIYGISLEDAQNKVLITAKDKLESEGKTSSKRDDFDDFDKIKDSEDEDEEEDDEEEEEEEDDDFNYEYNENDDGDDDDEDDDKPKKKKK
jgi:CarD family transcriptional regulator